MLLCYVPCILFLHRYYREHSSLQRGAWHSAPGEGQWKFSLLKTIESYRQSRALLTSPASFQMITRCGDKFSQHPASQSAQSTEQPAAQLAMGGMAFPWSCQTPTQHEWKTGTLQPITSWTDPQAVCENQAQILLVNY